MSFLKHLENIGVDILKGIQIASPIIGSFNPAIGAILTEVGTVIADLEQKGQTINPSDMSALVTAISTVHTVKQSTVTK